MRKILLTLMLLTVPAFGTTYYVDFSGGADTNNGTAKVTPWKFVKGMNGCASTCASTTLVSGDIVIFKGGVTWTFTGSQPIWTIVGGSSSMITYTTDHTWFNGGSFTQPIFDDGHANPVAAGMTYTAAGFITFNDLQFQNCGNSGNASDSNKCLVWENTHDITLTNNTFKANSWITNYFVFSTSGSRSNWTFTGNDTSQTTGAIWFASAAAGATEHN